MVSKKQIAEMKAKLDRESKLLTVYNLDDDDEMPINYLPSPWSFLANMKKHYSEKNRPSLKNKVVSALDLYDVYCDWCVEYNEEKESFETFDVLSSCMVQREKTGLQRYMVGWIRIPTVKDYINSGIRSDRVLVI